MLDFKGPNFDFNFRIDFLDVDGSVGVFQNGGQHQIPARLVLTIDLEDGLGYGALRPE